MNANCCSSGALLYCLSLVKFHWLCFILLPGILSSVQLCLGCSVNVIEAHGNLIFHMCISVFPCLKCTVLLIRSIAAVFFPLSCRCLDGLEG